MNFFEQQDRARHNTTQLLGLFAVAIAFTIAGLYLAAAIAFAQASKTSDYWHPELLFWIAGGTLLLVMGGSTSKFLALRRGGGANVALSLGGQEIIPEFADERQQMLLNVVEEMAIAAGVPVPRVFVLTEEWGINAFAAGFTTNDAAVAVTQGCLDQLDRDELQGVIAHEFSHILNGDMNLNLKLIGLLQGILLIHLLGRMLIRFGRPSRRSREEKGNPILFVGFAMFVVGGIGWLCSRAIKAAVSRQREYLADASAVQFTRNPNGISSALQKIAGLADGSYIQTPQAETASHMFFGNAIQGMGVNLFASHPPLKDRIRRIGGQIVRQSSPATVAASPVAVGTAVGSGLALGFADGNASGRAPNATAAIAVDANEIAKQVGTADAKGVEQAHALLEKLPHELRSQLRTVDGAKGCIYALLLDDEGEMRDRQVQKLRESESAAVVTAVEKAANHLQGIDARLSLPVVDLAVPALRSQDKNSCQMMLNTIKQLMLADGQVSLFEFSLVSVLRSRLAVTLGGAVNPPVKYETIAEVWQDCVALVAALAKAGHESEGDRLYAFQAGMDRLPRMSGVKRGQQLPPFTFKDLERGLGRLRVLAPKGKQKVVDACAHTVLLDGKVTLEEAELLRAFVLSLDCPLPPFLSGY
ncbi:MAG: M48 family metallopeptidase [Synechococcus sp.]